MNEAKYRAAEQRLWESVAVSPREQFVTLPRIGMKVRVQEVGEGEPVLFIHGGPNSGSTWAPIIEHFSGYRCLIVDRPGTGLSEPYTVTRENLARFGDAFVGDVLAALNVDSAHVVASSFGGMLALRSAAAEPHRLLRMVQMAAPALAPGSSTPSFMKGMAFAPVRWLIGKLPPNQKANDRILRQLGHGVAIDEGRFSPVFNDWYLALQRYTDTMENDGNMIGRFVSWSGFDPADAIPDEIFAAVESPTLFLWGADDGFGGEDVANYIVARMPNAELVMIPQSGHLPWLDDPQSIAKQTLAWLSAAVVQPPATGGLSAS
ncbi:MAG: alpha/beta hydrolase [Acidimicrobiia bacterium]|nr:alpha/beta hydrolase [Acidimicrobiia bacterium]